MIANRDGFYRMAARPRKTTGNSGVAKRMNSGITGPQPHQRVSATLPFVQYIAYGLIKPRLPVRQFPKLRGLLRALA